MRNLHWSTKVLVWVIVGAGAWFALRLFLAVLPFFLGSLAILGAIVLLLWLFFRGK